MRIKTVADLKALVSELPDDLPVWFYAPDLFRTNQTVEANHINLGFGSQSVVVSLTKD